MRRGGGLWMVTFRDGEPEYYHELPVYFKTRRGAEAFKADAESDPFHDFNDYALAVKAAPDDIRWADLEELA